MTAELSGDRRVGDPSPRTGAEVLVIGATGFVGGAVARRLVSDGHRVRGLARSDEASQALVARHVQPVRGDLDTGLAELVSTAREADVIVVVAQLDPETEVRTVTALLDALEGTGRTLVFTSGSGVLLQRTGGAWSPDVYAEDDDFVVEPLARTRLEVEGLVRDSVSRGVHGIVVRPGMIWGPGDHGHVAMTYQSVAATGAAAYVGEGLNTYANVHVEDVTALFAAAVDRGQAGGLYHAVSGETPTRWIAEAVARDLDVPTVSVTPKDAVRIWGDFGALIAGASSRIRAVRSVDELGWAPQHTDMLSTVGEPWTRALADVLR